MRGFDASIILVLALWLAPIILGYRLVWPSKKRGHDDEER